MNDITKIYKNNNNGGREKVSRIDGEYYVQSDFGHGFVNAPKKVSKNDMRGVLEFTGAPQSVFSVILGE